MAHKRADFKSFLFHKSSISRVKREDGDDDDTYDDDNDSSQEEFSPSSMSANKLAWLLRSLAETGDKFET